MSANLSFFEQRRQQLDAEKAERDRRTVLYFIQAQTVGLIKIGVAMKPRDRLASLQIGSPDKLVLLGVIRSPGARALEKELHATMSAHHSHGEWFRPSEVLLSYIAENAH